MASHYLKDRDLYELLKGVYENGYFQLVSFDYETPLWFYCNNLNDSKIHVSYEIMERLENEYGLICRESEFNPEAEKE